jgi:hypothetical protein
MGVCVCARARVYARDLGGVVLLRGLAAGPAEGGREALGRDCRLRRQLRQRRRNGKDRWVGRPEEGRVGGER